MWRFKGRDDRGWLVFMDGSGHRISLTPTYFWWGQRTDGAFMEVMSR